MGLPTKVTFQIKQAMIEQTLWPVSNEMLALNREFVD
jgi:hypothetical protein